MTELIIELISVNLKMDYKIYLKMMKFFDKHDIGMEWNKEDILLYAKNSEK